MEKKICVKHVGMNLNWWSLLVSFYEIPGPIAIHWQYNKNGLLCSILSFRTTLGNPEVVSLPTCGKMGHINHGLNVVENFIFGRITSILQRFQVTVCKYIKKSLMP